MDELLQAALNTAEKIAKIIGLPKPKTRDEIERTFKIAGLATTNANVFYNVVAPIHGRDNLQKLKAERKTTWKTIIHDSLADIMTVDYQAVFEIAQDVLTELPPSMNVELGLEESVRVAAEVASSRALLRHDLMGRIYHQLLFKKYAKHLATYYTSVPAAWLLAHLAIETPRARFSTIKWDDGNAIAKLRMIDPACGSGTLLSASYRTIQDSYTAECAAQGIEPDLTTLHRAILENALWGIDVLSYALHMAASSLALHNPDSTFRQTNLFVTPLGVLGEPLLGSLELLTRDNLPVIRTLEGESYGAARVELGKVNEPSTISVPAGTWDLVIMNPPFARSCVDNLLFGSIEDKSQRTKLLEKYSRYIKNLKLTGIGHAGLAATFTALALRLAAPRGRIALVLPKVSLMGESWKGIRQLILSKADIDYIILSDEPQSNNFSENTDLSETLLVATKRDPEVEEEPHKCQIVVLKRKPKNEFEAVVLSSILVDLWSRTNVSDSHDLHEKSVGSPFIIRVGGEEIGEAYAVSKQLLEKNVDNLTSLFPFTSSELSRATYSVANRSTILLGNRQVEAALPTIKTSELATVGPDAKQVYTNFDPVNTPTNVSAFWGRQEAEVRSIILEPNKYLNPKGGKTSVDRTTRLSSQLIIAQRLRSNTAHTLAGYLNRKVLSNEWWTIIPRDNLKSTDGRPITTDEAGKIWSLWMNSLLGILCFMACREETMGAWIQMKKASLQRMPILDLRRLNREQIDRLLSIFADFGKKRLARLGNQFGEAARVDCDRSRLDLAVLQTLVAAETTREDLQPLYGLLGKEGRFL